MWRLPSSSRAELTVGYSLMAATRARTANGMGESEAPSRSLNSSFARSRRRITRVMSISTALVSWALTWSEATMRWAMTLRVRVAGSTCSRSPLASGTATWGAAAGAAFAGAVDCRSRPAPLAAGCPPRRWAHPPAAAAALDLAEVDVVLAGQAPDQGRHPGRGLAVPLPVLLAVALGFGGLLGLGARPLLG